MKPYIVATTVREACAQVIEQHERNARTLLATIPRPTTDDYRLLELFSLLKGHIRDVDISEYLETAP